VHLYVEDRSDEGNEGSVPRLLLQIGAIPRRRGGLTAGVHLYVEDRSDEGNEGSVSI